jgi:hypothetical protein
MDDTSPTYNEGKSMHYTSRFLAALLTLCLATLQANAQSIFVLNASTKNTIHKFSSTGEDLGEIVSTGVSRPIYATFDTTGNLLVSNWGDNTVKRFSTSGQFLGNFATTNLDGPHGIVSDSSGNVYVGNWGRNNYADWGLGTTIQKYNSSGTHLGAFTTSGVSGPHSIVFDSQGNMLVANYGAGAGTTVRKFSSTGQDLGNFASTGLLGPQGIAVAGNGDVFVTNFVGGNIRHFSSTGTDYGDIVAGLNTPTGVAVDNDGNLLVSLYSEGLVAKYSTSGQFLGNFATGANGIAFPIGILIERNPSNNAVPEPSEWAAMGLLGAGLLGLVVKNRKKNLAN